MIVHGIWYMLHGYDQVFSRMPCRTYHFFLWPLLDPSWTFWKIRDYACQYIPLTVGLATLCSVFWHLLKQEANRRRDLRGRQDTEDIELQQVVTTLSYAVRYALERPDVDFLTNGGALPPPPIREPNHSQLNEEPDAPLPGRSWLSDDDEFVMSGAF
ncbi:hypothetical protein GQ53DRAFT_768819 [Thozetella sp. PMI_491]|nr:hypothetical protein GQ53DRAFT_768819 [Thozetella sp. PMI_491]